MFVAPLPFPPGNLHILPGYEDAAAALLGYKGRQGGHKVGEELNRSGFSTKHLAQQSDCSFYAHASMLLSSVALIRVFKDN